MNFSVFKTSPCAIFVVVNPCAYFDAIYEAVLINELVDFAFICFHALTLLKFAFKL